MYALNKLLVIIALVLGFVSSALAVPVEFEASLNSTLFVRGSYGVTHNGWATYYNPSAGVGACGWSDSDSELVAAIGTSLYQQMMVDRNPNHCKACGKSAKVTWRGKSVTVKIVDRCPGCGYNDIDLSPAAFRRLAALGVGKLIGSSWKFN
ncbi:putative effector protein [Ceratobasidium theobromae]|uniref:Putative effector protein n=1 Tax=Ceratobasidium theobromae TaxID=1582974 RepID=A0A5N5QD08_9AGAM|nr:putative effector protein [Ceratobasidium theobromae]